MRSEHYRFLVLRVTHESRLKFRRCKVISLSPRYRATGRYKAVPLIQFLF